MKIFKYNPILLGRIYNECHNQKIKQIILNNTLSCIFIIIIIDIDKFSLTIELGQDFFNENKVEINELLFPIKTRIILLIIAKFSSLIKCKEIELNNELNIASSKGSTDYRYICLENFPFTGKFCVKYDVIKGDNWIAVGCTTLPIIDAEPWGSSNLYMYICGPMYGIYPGGLLYGKGKLIREDLRMIKNSITVEYDMDKRYMKYFIDKINCGIIKFEKDQILPCIIFYSLNYQSVKINTIIL